MQRKEKGNSVLGLYYLNYFFEVSMSIISSEIPRWAIRTCNNLLSLIVKKAEIYSEDRAKHIQRIGDAWRCTLVVNRLSDIPCLIDSINDGVKNSGVLFEKDIWKIPYDSGYAGIHLKIHMPIPEELNKFMFIEVHIHHKAIMDGTDTCPKQASHLSYEAFKETSDARIRTQMLASSKLQFFGGMRELLMEEDKSEAAATLSSTIRLLRDIITNTQDDKFSDSQLANALFLHAQSVCATWDKKLKAIIPSDTAEINKAYDTAVKKIRNRFEHLLCQYPPYPPKNDTKYLNSAKTAGDLIKHAKLMVPFLKSMFAKIAVQHGCIVNYGPKEKCMIKTRQSIDNKVDHDMRQEREAAEQAAIFINPSARESLASSSWQTPSSEEKKYHSNEKENDAVAPEATSSTLRYRRVREDCHRSMPSCRTLGKIALIILSAIGGNYLQGETTQFLSEGIKKAISTTSTETKVCREIGFWEKCNTGKGEHLASWYSCCTIKQDDSQRTSNINAELIKIQCAAIVPAATATTVTCITISLIKDIYT